MHSTNLFDVYSAYLETPEGFANANKINSLFVRFLVPAWGGQSPKGSRATPKELKMALDFLKICSLDKMDNALEILEQFFILQDVSLENRRVYRYNFKKFFS